jgi:nicotinamide mononucleotide transporter
MSPLETIAAACGLLSVWLTVRRSLWCWPTGLVMVALYAFIFYDARLYSDMGLQLIYVVLQLYGWGHWLRGGPREGEALPVSGLSSAARAAWAGAALAGSAALGWATATWTDTALPYPDAFITALSLAAQWLMARKVWESWLGWILVDLAAIPVYAAKDLYLTAGLYTLFLLLASAGLLSWKRSLPAACSSASSCPPTVATSTS